MENACLIVGLGNPGPEYAATRHNVGFMLLEKIAGAWKAELREERRFKARVAQTERCGRRIILCQPQTFMNASGEAVGPLAAFYKVAPGHVFVALDDADLPLGSIRLRGSGGTGGHHGLESIVQHLGTHEFPRLRIGVAPGPRTSGPRQIAGFVLGRFAGADQVLLERVLDRAGQQLECWLGDGVAKAMNDFNGTVSVPEN